MPPKLLTRIDRLEAQSLRQPEQLDKREQAKRVAFFLRLEAEKARAGLPTNPLALEIALFLKAAQVAREKVVAPMPERELRREVAPKETPLDEFWDADDFR